jgi:hypothetical protein
MKLAICFTGLAIISTQACVTSNLRADPSEASIPRVFQYNSAALAAARAGATAGDASMTAIVNSLRERGDALLSGGPFTIVHKQHPLPGVDPHDYVSLAPYYWPNPDTPDHLPYIRRDGERNPETREFDARIFSAFSEHVWGLALAGYMTGDHRYSQRASELLRTWFIDPDTRMNPNLEHAQFVKGENTGRGTGIIESNRFLNVVDGIGLLRASDAGWTADDQSRVDTWFRDYLKWMQESRNGKAEAAATNNHGTWYDVQATTYLLFLGDETGARQVVEAAKSKRIAAQIQPDGQMPRELGRTKSWGYSCFNLKALAQLADLGRRVNVDLWNYSTPDGRSIRTAIDFHLPYALGEKKWSHQQIGRFDPREMLLAVRRAAIALNEQKYIEAVKQLNVSGNTNDPSTLGLPLPHQKGISE